MEPEELVAPALRSAADASAGYADVRWVREERESVTVTDDRVEGLTADDTSGVGVRVLGVRGQRAAGSRERARPRPRWGPGASWLGPRHTGRPGLMARPPAPRTARRTAG